MRDRLITIVSFINCLFFSEILCLKTDCAEKDIKQAYFKLAKKFHPDLNPSQDARDKFDKVQK